MLNFKEMYELGIKKGMEADPRGIKKVKTYLERVKKEYADLKPADKKYFEEERLTNPYFDDCRMHTGDAKTPIKRILAGIDADAGEIMLATQLNERGKKIDAVVVHHPLGGSLATLHGVMDMVVEVYREMGVPVHLAEKYMEERIAEVGRGLHPYNHYQVVDMARLLGVNLMNMHTPTDNMVTVFLEEYLAKKQPETIGDIMEALMEIPEYQEAKRRGAGPAIFAGSPKNKAGKFVVEMTGGTNPSNKVYSELSRSGISTVVSMHMQKDAREKANEVSMNVVIAGHMSSDSLGMNLYLDELEKKGVEIVPCGGLIRVSRIKKK
ncbi:MAG: NGG1p interacting factor NIF3 [Candidatus Magasanikbacteria bacterium RIFOXYD2_FULL_39_9]|uniref:NGG1p interacting factor NIF3 n=1 Tax=Candidatus Magasanikbacteria bacterium RIFOXYD1_FULL_40_23 TaxID=1798705 RepID=A0A1F6P8Y6_9BACT|nr:MAG: NGG1p interacting factor NIF3 [Candidatus Magasanikbacteria bacterium RIFOXYD2_FULL_39_9]OGH92645.1 MAG: NGG1p interacting factor NIF3 [Candidatus Magasanikbacteria bacterium RIFOXYD1_FULL_40_23]